MMGRLTRRLQDPVWGAGALSLAASLPLAWLLPGKVSLGFLWGAAAGLANLAAIRHLVRRRLPRRRRAGIAVPLLLLGKTALLLALLLGFLLLRWIHPLGLFAGLAASTGLAVLLFTLEPVGETS